MLHRHRKSSIFEIIQHDRSIIWNASLWENRYTFSFLYTLCTLGVDIRPASWVASIHAYKYPFIDRAKDRNFFQFFLPYKTNRMLWVQNTRKHHIYHRGMIGYDDVLFIRVYIFFGFFYKIIPKTHSIEHPKTPHSYQFVALFGISVV